ncbi:MAG: hypothetical protein HY906_02490 [Deltaproteobacteria bacterium]|nr:hypothetical protein [Deltaproteobacteria bacterium]
MRGWVAAAAVATLWGTAEARKNAPPSGAASQPASDRTVATVLDPAALDASLAALKGKQPGPRVGELLGRLGLPAPAVAAAKEVTVSTSQRHRKNLDADPAEESVVHVRVDGIPAPDHENATVARHFVAWLDPVDNGLRLVGNQALEIGSCVVEGQLTLSFQRVHHATFDDTVLEWTDAPECDGNLRGTNGMLVVTLERGRLDRILRFEAEFEDDRVSHETISPARRVKFTGKVPREAQVLEGKRVKQRLRFDRARFVYR